MLPRFLTSVLILLGFSGPISARTLSVELEVLHVAGQLSQAELNALLASPRLYIEAHYQPTRLIAGETARREKIMPIGSKLFAIGQITTRQGTQIERQGRSLRVRIDDTHPAHASYRLNALRLAVPIAPAPGRPQPDMEVWLANPVARQGAHEQALLSRNSAFDLGLRLRYRWDDAPGEHVPVPLSCHDDIQALGKGQYRFRQEPRLLRLFGSIDFGSSGQKIPAGARRFMLTPPYPSPLTGWQLVDQQLVQLRVDGKTLESLSLHAERQGSDGCRYMRNLDAWFADGQLVKLKRSGHGLHTSTCEEPAASEPTTEIHWNDDGALARFVESSTLATRVWDAFRASNPACTADQSPPPGSAEIAALRDEVDRLRSAFLQGSKP